MPASRWDDRSGGGNHLRQTGISVLIALHAVIVAICVSSNYQPSVLQSRLLSILRPYVEPLGLDWNFMPFFLTHGSASDMDCVVEFLSRSDGQWHNSLPVRRWAWESQIRLQRWARFFAFHVQAEEDQVSAEMAAAVASYLRQRHGEAPLRVRLRRIRSIRWETAASRDRSAPQDPLADYYIETLYEAAVLLDQGGQLKIVPVSARGRPAPPATGVQP